MLLHERMDAPQIRARDPYQVVVMVTAFSSIDAIHDARGAFHRIPAVQEQKKCRSPSAGGAAALTTRTVAWSRCGSASFRQHHGKVG
jgi:hypothetical protein